MSTTRTRARRALWHGRLHVTSIHIDSASPYLHHRRATAAARHQDGVDLLVTVARCSRGYTLRAAAAVGGAADTSWLEGPLQMPDAERALAPLGHMLNHAPSELANCAVEPPVLPDEGESAELLARVPTVRAAPVGAPPPLQAGAGSSLW